jgi:enoyl-CoA hydratase/carnithine racemase
VTVVLREVVDDIALVTLNRPERRNAMNNALREELSDAVNWLEETADLRVMVLTGAGTAFCSGRDLKDIAAGGAARSERPSFFRRERVKPVVAAVNGPAVAGGFEMVLACDVIVACTAASFALPEARRGLVPGGGGIFRLARVLGPYRTNELLLTGRTLSVSEALQLGIVNHVVEPGELRERSLEVARQLAQAPSLGAAAILGLVRGAYADDDDQWAHTDTATSSVNRSAQAREGAQAFLERREPTWNP